MGRYVRHRYLYLTAVGDEVDGLLATGAKVWKEFVFLIEPPLVLSPCHCIVGKRKTRMTGFPDDIRR